MIAVPVLKPETIPVELTEATVVALLVHMPPAGVPVSGNVKPVQTEDPPVMDGVVLMVIVFVAMQLPAE